MVGLPCPSKMGRKLAFLCRKVAFSHTKVRSLVLLLNSYKTLSAQSFHSKFESVTVSEIQ